MAVDGSGEKAAGEREGLAAEREETWRGEEEKKKRRIEEEERRGVWVLFPLMLLYVYVD